MGELFYHIKLYSGDTLLLSGSACWARETVVIIEDLPRKLEVNIWAAVWLVAVTIADIVITVSLVYSLVCILVIHGRCTILTSRR